MIGTGREDERGAEQDGEESEEEEREREREDGGWADGRIGLIEDPPLFFLSDVQKPPERSTACPVIAPYLRNCQRHHLQVIGSPLAPQEPTEG
jgi:hypothetical protein